MFLKDLLASDHPLFTINLQRLERATGNAGVDTRLIADITQIAHQVMRDLGLDPANTSGIELYNALRNAARTGLAEGLLASSSFTLINLGNGPISLNVLDVIENSHHELPYEQRRIDHGQRQLRIEVIRRYAEHDRTRNEIVQSMAREMGLQREDDADHISQSPQDSSEPHILAIGDIFTDVFIQLRSDQARIDTDADGSKRLSMPFGPKLPYDGVETVNSVGPSPNAAVAFSRLGVGTSLMAYLGDDQTGKDSLNYLRNEHISTDLVAVEKGLPSNCYYVLRYDADRTILVKNEKFTYAWQTPTKPPEWIYLALLSDASWQLHLDLLAYLDEYPDVKLAFQPGTFHFEWGPEKLKKMYARSHIVVMNREEAALVTGKSKESIADLAAALHDLGPVIVIITDGPDGSYASYDDTLLKMPNYPDIAPPVDRTGAGDAFAATIVAALALGEPIETALRWAPINSMNVVQKIGAQAGLLHREEIQKYLDQAPKDYTTQELG